MSQSAAPDFSAAHQAAYDTNPALAAPDLNTIVQLMPKYCSPTSNFVSFNMFQCRSTQLCLWGYSQESTLLQVRVLLNVRWQVVLSLVQKSPNCTFKKVQYPQASSGKFLPQDFLDERQHWKHGRMARAVFCIESLIDASAPARTSASKMWAFTVVTGLEIPSKNFRNSLPQRRKGHHLMRHSAVGLHPPGQLQQLRAAPATPDLPPDLPRLPHPAMRASRSVPSRKSSAH